MPAMFAGLCSGASVTSSRISSSTSSSTTVGPEKRSPPCTTRCPTANGASVSPPVRSNAASTRSSAAAWSGIFPDSVSGSAPAARCSSRPSSSPIRSTRPDAQTRSPAPSARSRSWYFSDDDPALSTRTGITPVPLPGRGQVLRLHGGDRHRVDDVGHQRPARQVVHRLVEPLQHRPDRDRAGGALHRLVGVVARVEVGEDEHRRPPRHRAARQLRPRDVRVDRRVVLDRPLDRQIRSAARGPAPSPRAPGRRPRPSPTPPSSTTASRRAARSRTSPRCPPPTPRCRPAARRRGWARPRSRRRRAPGRPGT